MELTKEQKENLKSEKLDRMTREIMGFFEAMELSAMGQNAAPGFDAFMAVSRAGNNVAFNLRVELGLEEE